jgi:uncharacterized protein (TIGR00251 family)
LARLTRLNVRVQPGARRERLVGWMADGTLRLAVAAPPEAGRANAAVRRLLAETLGVNARDVAVTRGLAARTKVIEIVGVDESEARARIERALNDGE